MLKGAAAPVALVVALAANPVYAQEISVAGQDAAAPADGGTIFVTGSRIRAPETATASPVVAVTAENIEQSGLTNLTELLTELPALFNSEDNFDAAGSQARNGAAGVNLLNLRNLGPQRTLVLVNGRRHISGIAGEAAVDTTTIPIALIDRIDVLTGGVSPVYGADGVSGVVNFVTKRDFEGIDLRAQGGMSDFGDAGSLFASGTIGKNFDSDRGNVALSVEYRRDERVGFGDRPNGRDDSFRLVRNPDDIPDDPNIPDNVFLPSIGYYESSPGGALAIDSSLAAIFNGNGTLYDPGVFLPQSGFLAVGGDNTRVASYQGDLQAQTEHISVNAFFNYELTDRVRFFAEGKYVRSDNFTVAQPSFDFYTFIPADNPFIPDAVAAEIAPGNFADFGLGDGVAVSRDNFDLGTRDETFQRDLYRTVVGIEGDIGENAQFELSYVFGQNDTHYTNDDNRIEDRYFAALDAVDQGQYLTGTPNGNIVCRSDLNGGAIETLNINNSLFGTDPFPSAQTFTPGDGTCRPLNLFGENVASEAALDFVLADLENKYTITQYVVNGFVSGDLRSYFELPGGPISYAIGGEYRAEKSAFTPDPLSTQTVLGDPNAGVLADLALLGNERGNFDVWEAFGELRAPLLADMPFAELLEVGAAVRFSDYSTIGTTTSWSVSGQYAPIRDVRFRGSYSKSVRAPNISELFAPRTGTFLFLDDPCDAENLGSGSEFREANCTALLGNFGIDLEDFDFGSDIASSASIEGGLVGNDTLQEERARTWTAGVILQPSFLPGLTLTADWYDIYLEDAINTASLQQTSEFCVDAPTIDNTFCDNITRNDGTGFVTGYVLRPENVAFFETAGADFTASYGFDLGGADAGGINLRATVGYLDKLQFLPANGGTVDVDQGESGAPKWNGTGDVTWQNENFSVNYGVQYIGEQLRYSYTEIAGNPDIADPDVITIGSRFIHDLRTEFRTDDEGLNVFLGVNNFTNELPVRGSINSPTGWLGRYFYIGLRLRSDQLGF